MRDCLFCRIIDRKLPAKIIFEDDRVVVFEDISPQAPVHTLVIPKKHIATLLDMEEGDHALFGHMVKTATAIARQKGIAERGFRLVTNCNAESGQSVYHIHLHLLGGRQMQWPPG
jgi:histidine triad (HIT) family protein